MNQPFSADTAAGIVASWLPSSGYEDALLHIDEALADLVAEGWLRPRRLPDGNVLFVADPVKCSTLPRNS